MRMAGLLLFLQPFADPLPVMGSASFSSPFQNQEPGGVANHNRTRA